MKRILSLSILLVLLAGCDKYIDIKEKGKVIPTTIKDFYQLMSDYDGFIFSTANAFTGNDEIKVYKDEVSKIFFGADYFANGYLWKDYQFINAKDDDRDWNTFYSQIYVCNVVLEKIDGAQGSDEVLRKKAKGEALAQRGYAYFMLANLYGKHYNPASYATDLAVPLYLIPDINVTKPRATVKEVYEQVEKDLTAALDLLPGTPEYNYHPSKAGVHGFLAKVYLYEGKYDLARTHANAALEVTNFLYDYKNYDYIPGAPKFLGLLGFPNRPTDNQEAVWHKESNSKLIYMVAVYMSDAHKALYVDGDRRLYFMEIESPPFGANAHGGAIWPKERFWKCGVTTPELYLIRAECNARLSQPGLAIDDLNTLRVKRFNTGKFVAIDRNQADLDALKLVLRERRLELFSECWRWFDLKRLNLDPRFRQNITRDWGGEIHTLTPESKNYVLAIPKKVMQLNTLLEQNPRDNKQ